MLKNQFCVSDRIKTCEKFLQDVSSLLIEKNAGEKN